MFRRAGTVSRVFPSEIICDTFVTENNRAIGARRPVETSANVWFSTVSSVINFVPPKDRRDRLRRVKFPRPVVNRIIYASHSSFPRPQSEPQEGGLNGQECADWEMQLRQEPISAFFFLIAIGLEVEFTQLSSTLQRRDTLQSSGRQVQRTSRCLV